MEKSFHQMKGDVGMHKVKNHRNKTLHNNMIVQSCVTPPCIIQVRAKRSLQKLVEQVEKLFLLMKDDVLMHNAKNHRNKGLHSKVIVQSCVTPPYILRFRGYAWFYYYLAMNTLVSLCIPTSPFI